MKKEFTEKDLRDAFNWGMTFLLRKAERNFKDIITKGLSEAVNEAFENMLRDKRI